MADGFSAGNLEFALQVVGKQSTASFSATNKQLNTMLNLVGKTNLSLKSSTLSLTKMVNKIYFLRNYTKQTFRDLTGIIQKAVDYTETLNLWQVAMRGNKEEAEDFVMTMNKAYGIATQTLMEYQAIFRNMLSSLGGVSGDVSYALSEYLTQMAVDYASLYNVSIQRAMTTFQSVLSGQVRPIRSIAGYDITETTIYQLYQQLGGTKTMRQLSQTEKRLLRIYAVFQQMESSGAVGDLGKTMGSTANQFRMFTESAKELGTWLGIVFEPLIRDFLPKLNAFVITLTNIVKAFARMQGIKPQEFGVVESVQQLNEELDKTQGKLLSFDRFESLNSSSGNNILGIDENLLAGLSQYESILSRVTGEAQSLAEQWSAIFIDPETGKFTEKTEKILNTLGDIAITIGVIIGFNLIKKLGMWGLKIIDVSNSFTVLNSVMKLGIIFSLYQMIDAFREGNTVMGIVYAFIMGSLVVAYTVMYIQKIKSAKASLTEATAMTTQAVTMQQLTLQMTMQLDAILLRLGASEKELDMIYALSQAETQNTAVRAKNTTAIKKQASAFQLVSTAISSAVIGFTILDSVIGSLDGTARKTVSIISMVAGALATVLGIILAIKGGVKGGLIGASIAGLGVGALVAGIKGVATQSSDIQYRKNGGLIEDGRFELSGGEIVGTFRDGKTVAYNNQQVVQTMQQSLYSAMISALKQGGVGAGGGDVYINKNKVGQIIAKPSHKEMVRTGLIKVSS